MQGVPEEEPEIGTNTTMLPNHKSPLGIGGKLRDFLGGLGDAFGASAGLPPNYANKRKKEMAGDALEGLADVEDSNGNVMDDEAMAKRRAIVFERLRKVDPDLALEIYTKIKKSGGEEAFNTARTQYYQDRGRSILGSMAKTATKENWPKLSKMMQGFAAKRGLGDVEVPSEYDSEWVDIVTGSAVDPYKAERLDDFDRDLDRKERQGNQRLAQGAERVRQGNARIRQGDERLAQGAERVSIARDKAKGTNPKSNTTSTRPLPSGWVKKNGKVYNTKGQEMRPPQ